MRNLLHLTAPSNLISKKSYSTNGILRLFAFAMVIVVFSMHLDSQIVIGTERVPGPNGFSDRVYYDNGNVLVTTYVTCAWCHGRGQVVQYRPYPQPLVSAVCNHCGGYGVVCVGSSWQTPQNSSRESYGGASNRGGSSTYHNGNYCKTCLGDGKCTLSGNNAKYACHGSGKCSYCGGTGFKIMKSTICPTCVGTGKCHWCGGSGQCRSCHGTGER